MLNYNRTYVLLQATKEERRVWSQGHAALIQRDGEELKPVCLIRAVNSLAWRGGRVNGLALPRRDCLRPSQHTIQRPQFLNQRVTSE
jgi:hypothetical protein